MATTPLEVISLQEAKSFLEIDFPDYDKKISDLIKASIQWVENYTGYLLYARDMELYSNGCQMEIIQYPINTVTVENDKGDEVRYKSTRRTLKLLLTAPNESVVKLNIGFEDAEDIPQPLIEACYKLITYLYENRDAYSMGLPTDVQGLINQYRRGMF